MKTKKAPARPALSPAEVVAKAADHFYMTAESIVKFCGPEWDGKDIWGDPITGGLAVKDFVYQFGADPAKLTVREAREASQILRRRDEAYNSRLVEENSLLGQRFACVVIGHAELDPSLNPNHPAVPRKQPRHRVETPQVDETPREPVKPRKAGKPGVTARIAELLTTASEQAPMTREEVHEFLVGMFPERNPESLRSTVRIQMPWYLRRAGHNVRENDDGYWID